MLIYILIIIIIIATQSCSCSSSVLPAAVTAGGNPPVCDADSSSRCSITKRWGSVWRRMMSSARCFSGIAAHNVRSSNDRHSGKAAAAIKALLVLVAIMVEGVAALSNPPFPRDDGTLSSQPWVFVSVTTPSCSRHHCLAHSFQC